MYVHRGPTSSLSRSSLSQPRVTVLCLSSGSSRFPSPPPATSPATEPTFYILPCLPRSSPLAVWKKVCWFARWPVVSTPLHMVTYHQSTPATRFALPGPHGYSWAVSNVSRGHRGPTNATEIDYNWPIGTSALRSAHLPFPPLFSCGATKFFSPRRWGSLGERNILINFHRDWRATFFTLGTRRDCRRYVSNGILEMSVGSFGW